MKLTPIKRLVAFILLATCLAGSASAQIAGKDFRSDGIPVPNGGDGDLPDNPEAPIGNYAALVVAITASTVAVLRLNRIKE